ncbi:MAG: biotin--[acetyl-CoA-carboxylase] ligase [Candidatus Omnitrophica bacterium]|nr:biotin--[acetyl-CoA-carboxylase] ligase [Candidatus Omnitrophota bacterium]MDD5592212.1 biotin--[acetyl-CoA-carboxylase] ligase [Candidatus Omnitrophota bacterium]
MMQEKILDFLKRKQDYISGDLISHRLGITRQALWKHIQILKDAGYDIVAVPHLGYKLVSCPDRLMPLEVSRGLNTKFVGKKIRYFDTVSSTMDVALQSGIEGSGEGTLILAETQTKGRGRLGREWFSPKYKGIYFSLILKPKILLNQTPLLTLMAAVSICEAIKEKIALTCQIKWPNDILLHHKKIGGILTELNAEADLSRFVAIGIGLNVNNDKKTLLAGATSLKEQVREEVNRPDLLREILHKIEENYLIFQKQGSRHIIDKWREWNVSLGRRVRVACQKIHIEGQALDIDTDGGLLIRDDSGLVQKVMSGDVVHCR